MAETLDFEATDVVRIILQFCKENGLSQSYAAIEQECQISLNTVDNIAAFVTEIQEGRWDVVLPSVARLGIPQHKLEDLYEHVVIECAESLEFEAGKTLLQHAAAMTRMRQEQPQRYAKIERMFMQPNGFDAKEAYRGGSSRKKRREALAKSLASEVVEAQPARLLVLLNQALKWQKHKGIFLAGETFDVLRESASGEREKEESVVTEEHCVVSFGKRNHAECASFSPDGVSLATGSADGFIEVYDCNTGNLHKDLAYQAEEKLMMHDGAVLALDFSADGSMLASGSRDGKIKVWRVSTGHCLRKFDRAHTAGITAVYLSRDGKHVLSASFDRTARVHGLKSGKMLKELRGHASYVNDARYTTDGNEILTASSDGTVRVWDTRSGDFVREIRLPRGGSLSSSGMDTAVVCVVPLMVDPKRFIACPMGSAIHIMTTLGEVIQTLGGEVVCTRGFFVTCVVSPKEELIYALGEDGTAHCFSIASGARKSALRVHDSNALGICHHPRQNILASFAKQDSLRVWKP